MKFELLADSIKQINDKASSAAKSAVNQLMTLRNWFDSVERISITKFRKKFDSVEPIYYRSRCTG